MPAGMDVANFIAGMIAPGPNRENRFSAGLAAMGQGYGNYIDQQKQLTSAGKAGKYYFDANPDALAEMGKTPEEAKNFGAQDWASLAQAHTEKLNVTQLMAKLAAAQANTAAQGALTAQQLVESTANQNFTQEFNNQKPTSQSMAGMLLGQGPRRNQTTTPMDIARIALDSGLPPEKIIAHLPQLATASESGAEEDNTPAWGKGPNGEDYMFQAHTKNGPVISPFSKAAARLNEIQAQGEATANKDSFPEGTEFSTTANGFGIATLPDGTMRKLGRVPTEKKARLSYFDRLMGGEDSATNAPAAAARAKIVTPAIASDYLQKAGGDKAKARAAAKADGYTF